MKGAIFCDIDGTLVPYGKEHAKKGVLDALSLAVGRGWLVCICTGREYESARLTFPSLENEVYFSTSSGACLFYGGEEVIPSLCLDFQTLKQIALVAHLFQSSVLFSVPEGIYTLGPLLPSTEALLEKQHTKPKPIDDIAQLPEGKVCECTLQFPLGEQIPLEELKRRWQGTIHWALGGPGLVDGALSDKGEGVHRFLDHFHIPREQAYAFGDYDNDIPMLDAVGHGYVMANTHRKGLLDRFPLHCSDLETTLRIILK